MDNREVFRGIFDGRYKLVRYFGLAHYNLPQSVDELMANNDVALYDLQNDPEEMNNLADLENPSYNAEQLASINDKLNALIMDEIGEDRGMRERLMQDL
jgi:arylsulfatase